MISPKRLSQVITEIECKRATCNLLELINCLTPRQRSSIKRDMEIIKHDNPNIPPVEMAIRTE